MNPVNTRRRALCRQCLRAQASCICQWIRQLTPTCEVLILQHPLETGHAKGSAQLLHLSLTNSRLVTGEWFAEAQLFSLLHEPWIDPHSLAPGPAPRSVLLYPETPQLVSAALIHVPPDSAACLKPTTSEAADQVRRLRLIILDGTWRKTSKMLHMNQLLQQLPRLALQAPPASRYLIRKARRADHISTLEACCHALATIENDAQKYLPLLDAFDGFVAQQAAYAAAQGGRNAP